MSLSQRKRKNEHSRARGFEPVPAAFAGVKRRARYLKRISPKPIKIKNPLAYLHSQARQRARNSSSSGE